MLLDQITARELIHLAPVLYAWFPHEIRAVRTPINRTLQELGQRPLVHRRPKKDARS